MSRLIWALAALLLVASRCDWFLVSVAQPAALVSDAARGELIFRQGTTDGAPPCIACHALAPGGFTLGPVMAGIGSRAGSRVAGLDADAYLRQSILEPAAFIVPGYRPIMYPDYAAHLSHQDIADLLAFLRTL